MALFPHIKIFTVMASLFMVSCGSDNSNDDALARVGNDYLYRSELDGLIPRGLSPQDSIQRSKSYIESWINHHILLQKAGEEVKSSMKEIDRQVENYKQDLVLAEYEQRYLADHLDTAVTPRQVEDFYRENASMFDLHDYVVNAFYLKFSSDEKEVDKIGYELKRCPDSQTAALLNKKYAPMASNSYYEPGQWIFLNDLLREIPLDIEDKTRFLENNPYIEVKTDEFVYLVRIFEYKLKNDTSPLNLVSRKIKTLILRKRAKDLLTKMHSEVIKQFRNENDVENYTK
jgi:hypothetical protein